jgi:hypothetical protein
VATAFAAGVIAAAAVSDFTDTIFDDAADFARLGFPGKALFGQAKFRRFGGSRFAGGVRFARARFRSGAEFEGAEVAAADTGEIPAMARRAQG